MGSGGAATSTRRVKLKAGGPDASAKGSRNMEEIKKIKQAGNEAGGREDGDGRGILQARLEITWVSQRIYYGQHFEALINTIDTYNTLCRHYFKYKQGNQ